MLSDWFLTAHIAWAGLNENYLQILADTNLAFGCINLPWVIMSGY